MVEVTIIERLDDLIESTDKLCGKTTSIHMGKSVWEEFKEVFKGMTKYPTKNTENSERTLLYGRYKDIPIFKSKWPDELSTGSLPITYVGSK